MGKASMTIYDLCVRGQIGLSKKDILTGGRVYIFSELKREPCYKFYCETTSAKGYKIREDFENAFLKRFMWDEIGQETVHRFLWQLQAKLDEIMPYYEQLYETMMYEYNPIQNANYTRETYGEAQGEGNSKTKASGESHSDNINRVEDKASSTTAQTAEAHDRSLTMNNTTPQGGIKGVFTKDGDIDWGNQMYMDGFSTNRVNSDSKSDTNANSEGLTLTTNGYDDKNESTVDGKSDFNNTNHILEHLEGNYGVTTTQSLIKEEREIIVNINQMILDECECLFMQVL